MTNANQTEQNTSKERAKTARPAAPPKRVTKKDQLIGLLRGKTGVGITTISTKLGWQAHTTRAALSGLRKAGYELTSEKAANGNPCRYRIVSLPPPTAVKPESAKGCR